ncbi:MULTISPECIES: fatty acid desaturase family protein [unclassified Brenneria]|uniref:fatty acid desaturase family protein n=1 Tax=unclassified Brenneria TaxID=2634434 RepID=UPI0018F0AA0B|nr:fatty acid desaturase family protein [Brenneria sp. L3-3C-1]MBJ7222358.1 fatty acid desaturase family protein [Brenneria sp. L3-3C-1]MEE3643601.1 fatty acid desaturase family protein [Brenneria sp. L3_3C_1]
MDFDKKITDELQSLSLLNNYRGAIAVLLDWLQIIIAISLSCYINNVFFYFLTVFFIGSRQRALATILHESAHRVLASNVKLNDFLGKYVSGYTIFQTFKKYARSHVILHHNFLGDLDKDPDSQYYRESNLFDTSSKRKFLWSHLISPLLLSKSPSFIRYLIKNRLGDIKDREVKTLLIVWFFILLLCYLTDAFSILFFYWIVPLITTFPMIGWFIELAEHYPIIDNDDDIDKTWNRFSAKAELFFTGMHAENYHLTHHLMPSIPFWNLKKAHEIMMQDIDYRKRNQRMGGIFLSANNNESLWKKIIKNLDAVKNDRSGNREYQ